MTDWTALNRRRREADFRETDSFPDVAYVRALTGRDVIRREAWHPTTAHEHDHDAVPALIGVTGKKRAGKDTFAKGLVERGFQRFAFADPLREAALALDPLIRLEGDETGLVFGPGSGVRAPVFLRLSSVLDEAGGWERAKEIREVRRTLQRFGRGIRAIEEDFWAKPLVAALEKAETPLVVTDVRFPNEAAMIRDLGGMLFRIVRPDLESTDTDESETALDGYPVDVEVVNDNGPEALTELAREAVFAF